MESDGKRIDEKYSVYLNDVEKWIDAAISRDGSTTDDELIRKAVDSFKRSIQANVEYHELMVNNSHMGGNGNKSQHSLMVEIYKGILNA